VIAFRMKQISMLSGLLALAAEGPARARTPFSDSAKGENEPGELLLVMRQSM
jgi:hypothetical protein